MRIDQLFRSPKQQYFNACFWCATGCLTFRRPGQHRFRRSVRKLDAGAPPIKAAAIRVTVIISSVMPVKTGIQVSLDAPHWTPASAGVTVIWGSSMLRKIMPVRGIVRPTQHGG